MGGLVSGPTDLIEQIYRYREITGAILQASAAAAILTGMKTLALRMERHNENALRIARWLQSNERIEAVFYPGLDDDLGHAIAARQMSGFGGVLAFAPRGGFDSVRVVLDSLRLVRLAAHLGGVATLAGPPQVTSHVELTAEERARAGIPENLIRYSVGIEDAADLIDDLRQAIDRI